MATVDDILNRRQNLFGDTAAQQPTAQTAQPQQPVQTTAVHQQQAANNLSNNGNNVQPGGVTINAQQLAAEQAKPDTATPVTPIKQGSNSTPEQKAAGTVAPKGDLPKNGNTPAWLQEQVEMGKKAAKENLDAINEKENADNLAKIGNDAVKSTLPQAAKKADATASSPEEDLYKKAYDDYMRFLEDDDKRIADEQERMKRNRLMATIGDGLRAMHEAYSYGRGIAPDSGGVSLSGKWRERMDKLEAERKANRLAHMNALEKMSNAKALADYRKGQLEIRQQVQDRLALEQKNKGKIAEAKEKYYEAMGNKNTAQANFWATKAELMLEGFDEDQAIKIAKARQLNASADKAEHEANKPYSTGGGGSYKPGNDTNMVKVTTKDPVTGETRVSWEHRAASPGGRGSGSRSSGSTGGRNNRGGNNAPPSRQNRGGNNAPPSRQNKK